MKLSATVSVSRVECSGNSLRNEDVHDQQDTLSRPARLAQPWHKQKLRDQGHPALEGALLEAAYQSAMGPIVESSVAKSYDYLGRTISAPDHLHTKGAKHGITLDGESFTPWNGTGGGPSIMPKKTPPPKYPLYNPWGWWK